jgi:hypothetical protein
MGVQRSQLQNYWPQAFLCAFYVRSGFRDGFDYVAKLVAHVAEQFADHAAVDENHGVIGAVSDGGAGELCDEQHLVADVADVGVKVFGQQVAIRNEQMVGGVVHGSYSIGVSHATHCTWREGLTCTKGFPRRRRNRQLPCASGGIADLRR